MVSSKKEINFIESYSCDLDFSFLKNHKEYLVQGVVNTHSGSGVNKTIKDCKEYCISPNDPDIAPYRSHLQECLDKYTKKYDFLSKHPHFNIYENINYQVYEPNQGYYEWHFESKCGRNRRVLVFMTYLTDTLNGGTEFLYQNIKTECVKGTTLLWPGYWTHTHRGIISKTHRKEILTGWFSTTAPS